MVTGTSLEDQIEFAKNPEPRCPCVLLVDTSGSMQNEPITALNAGLAAFKESLSKDDIAKRRVEVAVISFASDVKVVQEFVTVDEFTPPTLTAGGLTSMGTAINTALDMIRTRKEQYAASGVAYYRPWVFLITDGVPEGEAPEIFEKACARVQAEEQAKKVAFFPVGVSTADEEHSESGTLLARLKLISAVRQPVLLNGLDFRPMFVWLSRSMQKISSSKTSDQVALSPVGWGTA